MKHALEYADLVLQLGIALQPGQNLCIKSPPDAYWFAATLAERAYELGSGYVDIEINDQRLQNTRIKNQEPEQLEFVPGFVQGKYNYCTENNWAYIRIDNTEDDDAFADSRTDKVQLFKTSVRKALSHFYTSLTSMQNKWCVISVPGDRWARKVLGEDASAEDLWQNIIPILRLDTENPIQSWKHFSEEQDRRSTYLNTLRIRELHVVSEKTDLVIGIQPDACWIGGGDTMQDGTAVFPNLPTEELFTVPDYRTVSGTVATTKPFFVMGHIVENAVITIRNGEVTAVSADRGKKVLEKYFKIDAGSCRLGEVALVDEYSPIAQSGLLFHSTLFDENASSHIAFGFGYPKCLLSGSTLKSEQELLDKGCNTSVVHTDMMIGSKSMTITASTYSGKRVTIMKEGHLIL